MTNSAKYQTMKRTYKAAGYSKTDSITFRPLKFEPGPGKCGEITDGVVLQHDNDGAWIIDFKDFKEMYELAVEARR